VFAIINDIMLKGQHLITHTLAITICTIYFRQYEPATKA
jgi:hypothetical protein